MTKKKPASSSPAAAQAKSGNQHHGAATTGGGCAVVQSFQLKGHQESVLCLDYDCENNNNLLLSGSEDKTARLWDLRTSATTAQSKGLIRASLCIKCPGEVNSVVFGPLETTLPSSSESSESSSSSYPFGKDCCVFLAVGNEVRGYDLRYANSPIVQWNSSSSSSSSSTRIVPLSSTDEINQIVLSHAQQQQRIQTQQLQQSAATTSLLLAAADDAGEIRVVTNQAAASTSTPPPPTILRHSKPGAMVMACAFRPNHYHPSHHSHHSKRNNNKKHKKKKQQRHKGQQQDDDHQQQPPEVHTELLATGGTDCAIQLWDVSTNPQPQSDDESKTEKSPRTKQESLQHRPLQQQTMEAVQSGASQVCNPPMVYSLDWSPTGHLLAAGLGDGSVSLFTVATQQGNHKQQQSLLQLARLEEAHGSAVASVHFPTSRISSAAAASPSAASPDRLLLTAGNDGVVVAWDLGATLCEPHNRRDSHHHSKNDHDKKEDDDDDDDAALSQWMSLLQLGQEEEEEEKSKDDDEDDGKDETDDDIDDFECDQPKTLFGIQHGIKPNWMTTNGNGNNSPCTIFVADTSDDITAYTIPS